jgi:hypothetical protein
MGALVHFFGDRFVFLNVFGFSFFEMTRDLEDHFRVI